MGRSGHAQADVAAVADGEHLGRIVEELHQVLGLGRTQQEPGAGERCGAAAGIAEEQVAVGDPVRPAAVDDQAVRVLARDVRARAHVRRRRLAGDGSAGQLGAPGVDPGRAIFDPESGITRGRAREGITDRATLPRGRHRAKRGRTRFVAGENIKIHADGARAGLQPDAAGVGLAGRESRTAGRLLADVMRGQNAGVDVVGGGAAGGSGGDAGRTGRRIGRDDDAGLDPGGVVQFFRVLDEI